MIPSLKPMDFKSPALVLLLIMYNFYLFPMESITLAQMIFWNCFVSSKKERDQKKKDGVFSTEYQPLDDDDETLLSFSRPARIDKHFVLQASNHAASTAPPATIEQARMMLMKMEKMGLRLCPHHKPFFHYLHMLPESGLIDECDEAEGDSDTEEMQQE